VTVEQLIAVVACFVTAALAALLYVVLRRARQARPSAATAAMIGLSAFLILLGSALLFLDALAPDGVVHYAVPLALAAMAVGNALAIARDVLRSRRTETDLETLVRERTLELRRAQTDLVQAEKLASVGLLAAGVAHEINNPAAYVLANLTLLRDSLDALREQRAALERAGTSRGADVPTQAEMHSSDHLADETLRDAVEGLLRIRDIVADLRSLAQQEAHDPEPVRLAKVVETSAALALPTIRHRASLKLLLDRAPLVLGHAGKLSQVVINLVVNAAEAIREDATHPGHIVVRTLLLDDEAAQRVVLEVADNGRGIAAAQIGEIFRPLYTTKRSGTGLGLAICRRIVEEHGGRIEVESIVGEGTTVRVLLPELPAGFASSLPELQTGRFGALVPAAPIEPPAELALHAALPPFAALPTAELAPHAALPTAELTLHAALPPTELALHAALPPVPTPIEAPRVGRTSTPAPSSVEPFERRLVMIIDDEALLLKVLARFLRRWHRVAVAASVDEALRLLRDGADPDVLICDLMMPMKSGAEFYLTLQRERPELAERLTFMSGGSTDDRLNEFARTVGRATLVKPLAPYALLVYLDQQFVRRDERA